MANHRRNKSAEEALREVQEFIEANGGIRDERWKAQQIATVGIDRWRQEFECDFLASSSDKKLVPGIQKNMVKIKAMPLP